MARRNPRSRRPRTHLPLRRRRRLSGRTPPARPPETFSQRHDLLPRTRPRRASRAALSHLPHPLRQPLPEIARVVQTRGDMPVHISHDSNRPSATIEIPLENPLPDYDLLQLEQPTPRDVDAVLVSQGFRDLVDDARGVLMDLLAHPPYQPNSPEHANLDFTHSGPRPFALAPLTGAICPGGDESYRPGLWIVLRDPHAKPGTSLPSGSQERVAAIAAELVKRLQLA